MELIETLPHVDGEASPITSRLNEMQGNMLSNLLVNILIVIVKLTTASEKKSVILDGDLEIFPCRAKMKAFKRRICLKDKVCICWGDRNTTQRDKSWGYI